MHVVLSETYSGVEKFGQQLLFTSLHGAPNMSGLSHIEAPIM